MLAFGNNFTVTLDGNTFAGITKLANQAGHRQRCGKLANFAIDLEFYQPAILADWVGLATV